MFGNYVCSFGLTFLSLWITKRYFSIFFEGRVLSWLNKFLWCCFFLWQFGMNAGMIGGPAYLKLSCNVCFTFLVSKTFIGKNLEQIIFSVIFNLVWMFSEFFVGYFFLFCGIDYEVPVEVGSLLSKILLLLFILLCEKIFHNEKIKELPRSFSLPIMLVPIGSMAVVYNTFMINSQKISVSHIVSSFACTVIMLFINILVFHVYLKIVELFELRRKNLMYRQELRYYDQLIENEKFSMNEIRRMRHDIKNQLIYALELEKNGKEIELKEYLETLLENTLLKRNEIIHTGNFAVDSIVNYKYSIAKVNGIKFTAKLDIPVDLPFPDADLCIILGNALDNALEANIARKNEKRFIRLAMKYDRGNLIIFTENSFDGICSRDSSGQFLTRKQDTKNHGIGLLSMKTIVEQYHGFMDIENTENVFKVKVILYIKS